VTVSVDVLVIGAGPTGLYAAYYAGFRGLSVALMDSLPEPGGQISALYPEKLIYDIAGFPAVRGRDLVTNLVAQADRFDPTYLLGESAVELSYLDGAPVVRGAARQVTTVDGTDRVQSTQVRHVRTGEVETVPSCSGPLDRRGTGWCRLSKTGREGSAVPHCRGLHRRDGQLVHGGVPGRLHLHRRAQALHQPERVH
jgi:cation diffusion facilitator CzcD-associated flavoprotein CzcO